MTPRGLSEVTRPIEFHGMTVGRRQPPEYRVWAQMKMRCFNKNHPKYESYGGRGLDMDPRWVTSFTTFLAEVGPRPSSSHSIERVDNYKGYWPGNVKWATRKEQNRNKITNRLVTFMGKKVVLAALAEAVHFNPKFLRKRLESGMSAEEAITSPIRRYRKHTLDGQTHTLAECAKMHGMSPFTLRSRIHRGWALEQALSVPVDETKAHRT